MFYSPKFSHRVVSELQGGLLNPLRTPILRNQIPIHKAFLAKPNNKLAIILPVEVKVLSLVLVLVAVAVESAVMVFVTRTVTFVPPIVKVGDELPPKS